MLGQQQRKRGQTVRGRGRAERETGELELMGREERRGSERNSLGIVEAGMNAETNLLAVSSADSIALQTRPMQLLSELQDPLSVS